MTALPAAAVAAAVLAADSVSVYEILVSVSTRRRVGIDLSLKKKCQHTNLHFYLYAL